MTPVLPAFAGHIPKSLIRKYPNVKYYNLQWNRFPSTYLLDANEPLFQKIGAAFLKDYAIEFGTDHLYNCDTFNEMTPVSSDPEYIQKTGQAIYSAMIKTDPKSIWIMQGNFDKLCFYLFFEQTLSGFQIFCNDFFQKSSRPDFF